MQAVRAERLGQLVADHGAGDVNLDRLCHVQLTTRVKRLLRIEKRPTKRVGNRQMQHGG
jgi:hypothetical protein